MKSSTSSTASAGAGVGAAPKSNGWTGPKPEGARGPRARRSRTAHAAQVAARRAEVERLGQLAHVKGLRSAVIVCAAGWGGRAEVKRLNLAQPGGLAARRGAEVNG